MNSRLSISVLAISLCLASCDKPAAELPVQIEETAYHPSPREIAPSESHRIVLGVEDSWAPYARPDGTGMSIDIVKAAYAAMGIEVELQVMPYARVLQKVESGALLGCFNVSKVPLRKDTYTWGEKPLFVADTYMYQLADQPIDAAKLKDLRADHRIGLILGYEYGEFIDSNQTIGFERVKTQEQNITKLLMKRIHGTIMFEKVANDLLRTKGLQARVTKAFMTTPTNIHVAFSLKHPDSVKRARALDEGLRLIESSGIYAEILARY